MKEFNRQLLNPVSSLEVLIQGFEIKLSALLRESQSTASASKIRSLKKLLLDLYAIRDGLVYLNRYDLWVAAERRMAQMETINPNITGFHIYLDFENRAIYVCPLERRGAA